MYKMKWIVVRTSKEELILFMYLHFYLGFITMIFYETYFQLACIIRAAYTGAQLIEYVC